MAPIYHYRKNKKIQFITLVKFKQNTFQRYNTIIQFILLYSHLNRKTI